MTEVVEAPVQTPLPHGLLSVVTPSNLSDPHMLQGLTYMTDNCGDGTVVDATDWCDTYTPTYAVQDGTTVTAAAFRIAVETECAGINEFRMAKDRATKVLTGREDAGLVKAVSSKMVNHASAQNVTPGTVQSLPAALATLEDLFFTEFPWQSVVYAHSLAADYLASKGLLIKVASHYETPTGNLVVVHPNIEDVGPASLAAGAGNSWLWMWSKPRVWRGVADVSDPVFKMAGSANETQTITITGSPTGGSYTLTFDGQTTASIAYNANAATIQTRLEALSNIAVGDVSITGTGPFTVTFTGNLAQVDVPQMTATSSLTGGTAPAVNIATTGAGSTGTTDNSYRVYASRPYVLDFDCPRPFAIKFDLDLV